MSSSCAPQLGVDEKERGVLAMQIRSVLSSATTASGTASGSATVSETVATSISGSVSGAVSRRGSLGGGATVAVAGGSGNGSKIPHDNSSIRLEKIRGYFSNSNRDASATEGHPNTNNSPLSNLNQNEMSNSTVVLDTTQQHGYLPSISVSSPVSQLTDMDSSHCDISMREHQLVLGRKVRQMQCKVEEHDKTILNQDIIIRQQKLQIEIIQQQLAGKFT